MQELETNEDYEEREDEYDIIQRDDEQPVARCAELSTLPTSPGTRYRAPAVPHLLMRYGPRHPH